MFRTCSTRGARSISSASESERVSSETSSLRGTAHAPTPRPRDVGLRHSQQHDTATASRQTNPTNQPQPENLPTPGQASHQHRRILGTLSPQASLSTLDENSRNAWPEPTDVFSARSGLDSSEPVGIFFIEPERDGKFQAWIDFRWSADSGIRLVANIRARLEGRPSPARDLGRTELILQAHFTPAPESCDSPRSRLQARRIVTGALQHLIQDVADYIDDHAPTPAGPQF